MTAAAETLDRPAVAPQHAATEAPLPRAVIDKVLTQVFSDRRGMQDTMDRLFPEAPLLARLRKHEVTGDTSYAAGGAVFQAAMLIDTTVCPSSIASYARNRARRLACISGWLTCQNAEEADAGEVAECLHSMAEEVLQLLDVLVEHPAFIKSALSAVGD